MSQWDQLASKESIDKTIEALEANGIDAKFVQTGKEAKIEVLSLIPQGAEVMNMTSRTLDTLGIAKEIEESGKYNSMRKKLMSMDRNTMGNEMRKMGAAPDWAVGSVHAVTENGHVLIASNSGSQLPAYINGSAHVVWVAGAQKIVKDMQEGIKRIDEYCLPLENERAQKVYGMGSAVKKIIIINKETPGRINLILVNEVLGF